MNRSDSEDSWDNNWKLIWQQVEIDGTQFGFMQGCGTTNVIFYFQTVTGEVFSKKERLALKDLKAFAWILCEVVWSLRL